LPYRPADLLPGRQGPERWAEYRDGFEDPKAQAGYDELYARASYFEALEHTGSTEQAHMTVAKWWWIAPACCWPSGRRMLGSSNP
jgi:hypothetical protein